MISPASAAMLHPEWAGVVQMRERMKTLAVVAFATGAINAVALREVLYNLPLLLAFDVLRQALALAKREGQFRSQRTGLGDLMDASQTSLAWIDWPTLRAGVRRRNEIAHDGKLFDSAQCLSDIDLVENQLKAWGL